MKARRIITIILSVFVAASIIYLIAQEVRKPARSKTVTAAESQGTDQDAPDNGRVVTVYYFHTTYRCPTCMRIEALTASSVKKFFPAELAAKRMIWKPVNIELPENNHFADDFKLFTKSVIIVDAEKGRQIRWKNLERIWELVRNEPAFTDYIKNEVTGYLKNI